MTLRRLRDALLGRPLRTDEESEQRIGPLAGVPVLGLDALASASYGPEAALTAMLLLGAAASPHIVPISVAILALMLLVFASYRQTIAAYRTAAARSRWRGKTSGRPLDSSRRARCAPTTS